MRSVVVVLPASMWAMIPMFRYFSSGVCRAMTLAPEKGKRLQQPNRPTELSKSGAALCELRLDLEGRCFYFNNRTACNLPAVVREGLVGLRHLVGVLALLHRVAAVVRGIHDLGGQLLRHGLLAALLGVGDQPAHAQRQAAVLPHFHRDLVGGAAHAAGLHLEHRLHVVQRLLEDLERLVLGALGDDVEGAVADLLGDGLLALAHQVVHELGDQAVLELGVRQDLALLDDATTGHGFNLPKSECEKNQLGRLAPYLERDCLRPCTPTESSVPRMMW